MNVVPPIRCGLGAPTQLMTVPVSLTTRVRLRRTSVIFILAPHRRGIPPNSGSAGRVRRKLRRSMSHLLTVMEWVPAQTTQGHNRGDSREPACLDTLLVPGEYGNRSHTVRPRRWARCPGGTRNPAQVEVRRHNSAARGHDQISY